ncbi:MAG: hypothetical protein K1X64_20605 [Myxococcaceae bacterium]|nr:hypothetical protein [Myxococcaceae bacterium]
MEMTETTTRVKEQLTDFNQQAQRFIRANPGACLLGALALGVLMGKLASLR